jgi:hypothetical protein
MNIIDPAWIAHSLIVLRRVAALDADQGVRGSGQ